MALSACELDINQNKNEQEADSEINEEEDDDSLLYNLECYFMNSDPSCIKFDFNEKDKLVSFFEGQNIDTKGLEVETKPFINSAFSQPSNRAFYWVDGKTGEVVYEVGYNSTITLTTDGLERDYLYIEFIDFKNNKKLFLDNSN